MNDNAINQQAWEEWLEYRKAKKKPVSDLAAKKQFKVLALYTHEVQQKIIDQSIMNDYTGLFPPKHEYEKDNRSTRGRSIEEDLLDRSWAK